MLPEIDFSQKSDEELAELSLKSQMAFSILMNRYEARLIRYIQRISHFTEEMAEDVLQESFIKMYKNLANFDANLSFSAWAYRIVHNQTITEFRKDKRRPHGNSVFVSDDFLEQFPGFLDIEQEAEQKILAGDVKEILAKLDIKYREVLILYYLEGYSYKEISDILMKPAGTVATLINRAKKKCLQEVKQKTEIWTQN
ncbi:RNA polymerase sigma factor [Patescibacteria group bacterium]|nr:RNA polymerase sigma factor [Patescibacteria group bacterium]